MMMNNNSFSTKTVKRTKVQRMRWPAKCKFWSGCFLKGTNTCVWPFKTTLKTFLQQVPRWTDLNLEFIQSRNWPLFVWGCHTLSNYFVFGISSWVHHFWGKVTNRWITSFSNWKENTILSMKNGTSLFWMFFFRNEKFENKMERE